MQKRLLYWINVPNTDSNIRYNIHYQYTAHEHSFESDRENGMTNSYTYIT